MAYEYIVNGKTVRLPISHDKVAVRFRDPSDAVERRAVIDPKPEVGSFDNRYEVPNEKLTVIDVAAPDHPGPLGVAAAVGALSEDPAITSRDFGCGGNNWPCSRRSHAVSGDRWLPLLPVAGSIACDYIGARTRPPGATIARLDGGIQTRPEHKR